jgi:ABC-type polysaccharide/polyol phosphate export permease
MDALRLVLTLGWSDFLLKYRGSFLGYVWSFAYPLAYFLVLLHVFRPFVTDTIPYYPYYLFLGIIIWEHFSVTTSSCISMLFEKMGMIQKVVFPREWLIFAVGWTTLIIFFTRLLIFFAIAWIGGIPLPLQGLWYLPLILIAMVMLSLGCGMLLSAFALRYRDISHLWALLLQVIFWLTPIAYATRSSGPVLQGLGSVFDRLWPLTLSGMFDVFIQFQPLTLVISAARRSMLAMGSVPSLAHMAGLLGVCTFMFFVGLIVFRWRSVYFVQEL